MTSQEQPPGGGGFTQLDDVLADLRAQLDGPTWAGLVAELPGPTDAAPIRIAFVGPYNAGKSSLIAALTRDLTIRRSGKPESSEARRYQWRDDVELVDLPGWFSGFTDHDDRAGEDLRRNADLVAFVMTVELGDELVVEAIEQVMGELGFAQRAVVVVNKAQTEDSDHDVVREEINRRLGRFESVPVIPTDAQNFLDTISGEFDLDEETIEILSAGSGIGDLAEALDDLVARHRDTARLQARALQSARVVHEALARLIPHPEEEAAAASLDQLDAALSRARARLADLAASHLTRLEAAVVSIADRELAAGGMSEAALEQAWDEALAPADQLGDDAYQVVADLAADFGGVLTTIGFAADQPDRPGRSTAATSSRTQDPGPLARRLLGAMGIDLTKASNVISKAADKVARDGSRQGSISYDAVRKLQPRKKFAPHGRLKDAEKFRKGAKVASKANVATPVVEEAWKWWREIRDTRAAEKAEAALRSHYADLASAERRRVEARFEDWTNAEAARFQQMLVDGRAPLDETAAVRKSKRQQLADLHEALTSLAASPADDGSLW
jgi:signal recognition particle receptor subunit beta